MFEEIQTIELSGESYPIKCDILVLEKIQDKYGDLGDYENRLSGFKPKIDDEGEKVRNDKGYLIGTYGIPDIAIVNEALVWFVKEGIEIEKENGKEFPDMERESLLRKVDMNPEELGRRLHEEFSRCFERKNEPTTQGKKMEESKNR